MIKQKTFLVNRYKKWLGSLFVVLLLLKDGIIWGGFLNPPALSCHPFWRMAEATAEVL
jgi:hypothetical protein